MSQRRSLKLPITLAIVMIVLLVVLTIGWVVLAVFGALKDARLAGFYWTALSIGTTFLIIVLVGVCVYLGLSIKAINLTRRQSNFVDSVTHELKSPIASLKLYLQTLNRRQVSQQEQAAFFRYMLEDVERLDHLINHVIDAGRLERGTLDGDAEDVPLPALLRECADTVCLLYQVPPQTIRFDTEPCVVRSRRVELDLVFRNLIDNAVKYAGMPPQVEVSVRLDDAGHAVVRIADNGPGIPPRLRRKIFGRFVRLGMELERQKPGTGLGLYIVRTVVRRMRGRIEVHDRDGGPGTVFEVRLQGGRRPAAEAGEERQQPQSAEVA